MLRRSWNVSHDLYRSGSHAKTRVTVACPDSDHAAWCFSTPNHLCAALAIPLCRQDVPTPRAYRDEQQNVHSPRQSKRIHRRWPVWRPRLAGPLDGSRTRALGDE